MLRTLGAPERRLIRSRRGRRIDSGEPEPEPVPTARATVVRPRPFSSAAEAEEWLAAARGRADEELAEAVQRLNAAVHAHRVAAADPYAAELSAARALVARIGFGTGEEVADGRFRSAWELPRERGRTRRSMEAPEERFAAILGGHAPALPAEELVLRGRADLDAGRDREAALQARVALESLLAGLASEARPGGEGELAELEALRSPVGEAANAALRGELPAEARERLAAAVRRMEAALRRHRLRS